MAKIRIHELAKELDMQGKDILSFVQEKGVEARSVSSSLEDDMADTVRKRFSKGGGKQEPEKPVNAAVEGKKEETPVRREAEKKDTEKRETEKRSRTSVISQGIATRSMADRNRLIPQITSIPFPMTGFLVRRKWMLSEK